MGEVDSFLQSHLMGKLETTTLGGAGYYETHDFEYEIHRVLVNVGLNLGLF